MSLNRPNLYSVVPNYFYTLNLKISMHLVRKKIKGNIYLYMYDSVREGGRVKKVYRSYIGPEGVVNS